MEGRLALLPYKTNQAARNLSLHLLNLLPRHAS
jgi:hypothetical protein